MLSFRQARILCIRQVTQLNGGKKKNAGIDAKLALTNAERFTLEKKLCQEGKRWQHQALRQTLIAKPDGTIRTLKMLIIADRAWQCLIKRILQRASEAHFHEKSYGFRSGRGTYDAQKYLFNQLRRNCNIKNKKVIQLEIENKI